MADAAAPESAFRFKRAIHFVDATTIQLIARCMDWAKHRRRKAAAQCHLRLDLQTFLPRFAVVGIASEHDSLRARELCAGVRAGEIVVFDKTFLDFAHLADLVLWWGLEERRYGWAWLAAGLLPLTRGIGAFAVLPIAWHVMQPVLPRRFRDDRREGTPSDSSSACSRPRSGMNSAARCWTGARSCCWIVCRCSGGWTRGCGCGLTCWAFCRP